jgi:hypothetical protein
MSYSDRPYMSNPGKIGCIIYYLVAFAFISFCLLMNGLGHSMCDYEPNSVGCEWHWFRRFALFPGSLIAAIFFGFILLRWLMKDRD